MVSSAALGERAIIPDVAGRAKQTRSVGALEYGWV